jgi:hypothetical protein
LNTLRRDFYQLRTTAGEIQKRSRSFGQVAFGSPMPDPCEVRKQLPKRNRPCQEAGSRTVTDAV